MARIMAVSVMLLAVLVAAALVAEPVAAFTKSDFASFADSVASKPADDTPAAGGVGTVGTASTGTELQPAAVASRTIVVDQSGKGNYKTVQQAINAVPNNNKVRVVIIIRPGVYRCAFSDTQKLIDSFHDDQSIERNSLVWSTMHRFVGC
jgi:pectin methylesterase-like acyl-CoA thioesterase